MESICLTAYAKINIGLDILGRRADGYHEISPPNTIRAIAIS